MLVGEPTEQPSPKRPHEEAHREDTRGVQKLCGWVARRKEGRGKVKRREGVGVEVVPLDEIA